LFTIISCLLQKPLHHFLPCSELFTPHLLYVLFWAKLQVSPLHYHMHPEHSPSLAEQQSSSQWWQHWIHGQASKHIIECSVSKQLSVKDANEVDMAWASPNTLHTGELS
jgi:hypothetical protein